MKKDTPKSIYLKDFEKKIQDPDLRLVSFDIFDTLFFRKCALPSTIFRLAGGYQEVLDVFGDADTFMNYRMEAERQAREKDITKEEITLDEIYSAFELPEEQVKRLQQIELEVENEHLVVNHAMEEFIQLAYEAGKKILLVSDMYMNKNQIEYICLRKLKSVHLISEIWVSSEYGKTKRNGSLFEEILLKERIDPRQMLHIGDNFYADHISALKNGISSILYNDNEIFAKMKEYEVLYANEDEMNGAHIRRYAVLHQPYSDPLRQFYYVFGSFILGPLLYGFNSWLNQIAKERDCRKIFFFMREGWLLKYFFDRQYPYYDTELIYSSRDATTPLLFENGLDDVIKHAMTMGVYSIADIYKLLEMEIGNDLVEKNKNLEFNSAWKVVDGNLTLLDIIKEDINKNEKKIQEILEERKGMITGYFDSLGIRERDIIVDFGPGGTIFNRMRKMEKYKAMDLSFVQFYMSAKGCKTQVKNKTQSFLSYGISTKKFSNAIQRTPAIFEIIFNLDNKSTQGYLRKGKEILPVFKENMIDRGKMEIIKESIMAGIQCYMNAIDVYEHDDALLNRKYLAAMMARVIGLPTLQEVEWLSELEADEGDGSSKLFKVIERSDIDDILEVGLENWFMEYCSNETDFLKRRLWPEGIMTKISPELFARIYKQDSIFTVGNRSNIEIILQKIIQQRIKEVMIYGVGEFYRELSSLLKPLSIEVRKLIDLRAEAGSFYIDGMRVMSLSEALNDEARADIIIASGAYVKEISEKILTEQQKTDVQVNIISV